MSTKLEEVVEQKIEFSPPGLYEVLLHNDEKTTMDFVIAVLEEIFGMEQQEAVDLMMKIHEEGSGVAGIFVKEIAEQKVHDVIRFARFNHFPLQASMRAC